MKTILLATDFSEGSANAGRHANKLAKKTGASLIYLHALSPPVMDINVPPEMMDEIYRTSSHQVETKIKELVSESKNAGIDSSYIITLSDLPSGISEAIEEQHVDLIIVAKTGHPGFFEKLLGSTARHLIHKFRKPLLIIPEEAENEIFEHILYATRLEFDEIEILKQVYEIKKLTKAKMTLAKVDDYMEINVHDDKEFIEDIHAAFPENAFEIIHEKNDTFVKGIQVAAEKIGASMLVVATMQRNLIEGLVDPSKSKRLVEDTGMPVLVYNF